MKEFEDTKKESEVILDSLEGEQLTNNISKISFIFVAFLVVAGGYVTQIFSCSTQRFLSSNIYGKHLIGIGLIFIFIMLEGGFNFDKNDRELHPVDWSNGNCFDSMIYAVLIYAIFLFSSKTRLGWNTAFFSLLFILYITNTQRLYNYNRRKINSETNDKILMAEKAVLYLLPFILVIGMGDYYFYKLEQLGKEFSHYHFFLGNPTCSGL
jgi:hypothetical protein